MEKQDVIQPIINCLESYVEVEEIMYQGVSYHDFNFSSALGVYWDDIIEKFRVQLMVYDFHCVEIWITRVIGVIMEP